MTISATTQGLKPGVCLSTAKPSNPFDGQVIYMTDVDQAAVWDGTTWTVLAPIAGGRNVIINGAMQVTQRSAVGTAVASITTDGYYTADRWNTIINSLGTWSQTTVADAPTGSGFRNSLKMDCTTADASPAAGDYCIVRQKIEGQNLQQFLKGTASAKPSTLSFWVKSFQTGTFICELEDTDSLRSVSASYTVLTSNTWEYKTIVFPADTTGVLDNDANTSFIMYWWLGSGTTYTSGTLQTTWGAQTTANRAVGQTNVASATTGEWYITGVQFEVGAVATPFEFEDIGVTLAKCQRYYEKSYADGVATATNTATGVHYQSSFGNASGQHFITVRFQTLKRANPTVSLWTQAGGVGAWAVISSPQAAPGYAGAASVINTTTKAFTVNQSDGGYSWQGGQTLGHWEAAVEL